MIVFLQFLLRLLYRFGISNPEVLKTPGPVLLLPNHTSWWDWLLVGICLEKDWRFVTSAESAQTSWFHKKVMINRRTFPVDINSAYAVKHMAEYLQKGGRLVLFPEGRLSRTGSLMKLYDGTGFLIRKTNAKIITCYLRGAGRMKWTAHHNFKRCFPRVTAHFSEAFTPPRLENVSATQARTTMTNWLRDKMITQQFEVEMEQGPPTVPGAIARVARERPRFLVMEDATRQQLTYRRLMIGVDDGKFQK